MASKYGITPLANPTVVTGYALLKNLVGVNPPPLHYFAAVMDEDFFIFDTVERDKNGIRVKGDFELAGYLDLVIANEPFLSVLTVRPAHARYTFAYGDFGKNNPNKAISLSEAKGLRYMEALNVASDYILLFRKMMTCNERQRIIGDWAYEYYTPQGKLLTRKFWITEEYILDENNIEETEW